MELFNSISVVRGFFCHSIQCLFVHSNFQRTVNCGKIRVKETRVTYSLQNKVMFFLMGTFQNRLDGPPAMNLPLSPFNELQISFIPVTAIPCFFCLLTGISQKGC